MKKLIKIFLLVVAAVQSAAITASSNEPQTKTGSEANAVGTSGSNTGAIAAAMPALDFVDVERPKYVFRQRMIPKKFGIPLEPIQEQSAGNKIDKKVDKDHTNVALATAAAPQASAVVPDSDVLDKESQEDITREASRNPVVIIGNRMVPASFAAKLQSKEVFETADKQWRFTLHHLPDQKNERNVFYVIDLLSVQTKTVVTYPCSQFLLNNNVLLLKSIERSKRSSIPIPFVRIIHLNTFLQTGRCKTAKGYSFEAISPDNKYVALNKEGNIVIFMMDTQNFVKIYNTQGVKARFSLDGKWMVIQTDDRPSTIKLFYIKGAQIIPVDEFQGYKFSFIIGDPLISLEIEGSGTDTLLFTLDESIVKQNLGS